MRNKPATKSAATPDVLTRVWVPCELKAADTDASGRTFEGYASIFGSVDLGGDRVLPGAFRKSIKAQGGKVPLYWDHQSPIGMADVTEDEKGLRVVGYPLVDDVQQAREGMALVKAGAFRKMSFGYYATVATRNKEGVRELKEVDLVEVTLTQRGMHPGAGVTALKSASRADFKSLEELVEALRDGRPMDEALAKALAFPLFPRVESEAFASLCGEAMKVFGRMSGKE